MKLQMSDPTLVHAPEMNGAIPECALVRRIKISKEDFKYEN